MSDASLVAVTCEPTEDAASADRARALAAELDLPLRASADRDAGPEPMRLVVTPERLELRVVAGEPDLVGGRPIAMDLATLDTTTGPGRSLRQPLMRAVGLRKGDPHRPTVIDATAGFGEDAWLLAGIGCDVLAVERHPVIAVLLGDAARRAAEAAPEIAGRFHVMHADSAELLAHLDRLPDALARFREPEVVYVDPMFPPGRKTLERKPMRVLRWLLGKSTSGGDEEARLLAAARRAAGRRVVVKRPLRGEPWAGEAPTATHKGSSVRYDVYVG